MKYQIMAVNTTNFRSYDLMKRVICWHRFPLNGNCSGGWLLRAMLMYLKINWISTDGSASALVTHLLEQTRPDQEELDEIQKTIQAFECKEGGA